MDNVELARKAWTSSVTEAEIARRKEIAGGDVEPGDYMPLYQALTEDVAFTFTCPEDTPRYGGEFHGRQALVDLFTTEPEHVVEVDWERPLEFLGSGDRVVMLGAERYRVKKTGALVRNNEIAIVMDFRDGLISRMLFIMDLSDLVEAQRG